VTFGVGFFLVGGGLSVAWAEKNLFSELAYQYRTMTALFRDGGTRLERTLEEAEQLLDEAGSTPDAAARTELFERIERMQADIYELGREALDENAEWLILHRARPLEPVMAG